MLKDILFAIVVLFALYFIGVPLYKLIKLYIYDIKDPLESAQARLERARKEAAAAVVDKETDQVYQNMYKEDDESSEKKG